MDKRIFLSLTVTGEVIGEKTMRKVLSLLLVLSMLFVFASCGGGDKADSKNDIIKPSSSEEDIYLYDSTWGNIKLLRVTTDSRPDAEELLELIMKYLASLGIDAEIKALYAVPTEAEDYAEGTLPVKVYFKDGSIDPVYVTVMIDKTKYTPGKLCTGSYRDSDVVNDEYLLKSFEQNSAYAEKLADGIGIGNKRTDISGVFFPIFMVRDLSFELPSESHSKLMSDTIATYEKYVHAEWYNETQEGGVTIDGWLYQKIISDTIKSYEDLKAFRMRSFTEFVADEIEVIFGMTKGEHPIYLEKDGAIYIMPIGMGGPLGYRGAKVKYVAEKDGYLFMLIEGEWTDFDDDFNPTAPYYTYDMYVYEKDASGAWKCDSYADIAMRRYETGFYK